MPTRTIATIAAALTIGLAGLITAPANAHGVHFANCTKLAKRYPHGVAKSKKAAKRQVRDGYGMPAHSKKAKRVYKANRSLLDRDKDGTACER